MGSLVARFRPSSSIGFLLALVFLNFNSLPMLVLAKWQMRSVGRYNVQAPVFFSWKDLEGGSQVGEGTTRDISTQAAFGRYLGGCDANRLEQIRALNSGLDEPNHV